MAAADNLGKQKLLPFETRRGTSLLIKFCFNQIFSNLHCIQSGTLADLVANAPEGDAVGIGNVGADAAYRHIVLTCNEQRHWVFLVSWVVDNRYTSGFRASGTEIGRRNRLLGLAPNGFRVGAHYWNTHASCAYLNVGMHNLLGLVIHFHFLLGVIVVGEDVDMRNDIVEQLR